MNEKIVRFGDKKSMIGILTEPSKESTKDVAFIFLNSGLIHRIGPFQFYVWAARELADDGFACFRIDLSGKGDSAARKSSDSYSDIIKKDVDEAMDRIEKLTGIKKFVICGICTGADNTYEVGFHNDRVVGIVPIDGYAYKTTGFYMRHYGPKVFRFGTWFRLAKRILGMKTDNRDEDQVSVPKTERQMVFPPKDTYKSQMASTLTRGVKMLVVFTGGWSGFYNYQEQFKEGLPGISSHGGIQVNYLPRSDHTFILRFDRENLISQIRDWAKFHF